jgi:hypothetical protein
VPCVFLSRPGGNRTLAETLRVSCSTFELPAHASISRSSGTCEARTHDFRIKSPALLPTELTSLSFWPTFRGHGLGFHDGLAGFLRGELLGDEIVGSRNAEGRSRFPEAAFLCAIAREKVPPLATGLLIDRERALEGGGREGEGRAIDQSGYEGQNAPRP